MAKNIRVRTTSGTFRRAGFLFTDKPTDIPLADLKKAQVDALKGEPMLVVQEIEIKPEAAAKK